MNKKTAPHDHKRTPVGRRLCLCLVSAALTGAVMILLFRRFGYAPFDNLSLACMDAKIQYMDLFQYLKDVLDGRASLSYSFSSQLGVGMAGNYAYYLSSPLNLLLFLFRKEQMPTFFDLLIVLKMALAAFTFAYYIQARFSDRISALFTVLLSLGYAFMQYDLFQSSNVMWLDAVYMLPLVLLGTYRVVCGGSGLLLGFSTGLMILFGWYGAGMACMFAAFWALFETALHTGTVEGRLRIFRDIILPVLRCALYMLLGVLLSCVLFLPAILNMRAGKGSLDLQLLLDLFRTSPLSAVSGYMIGYANEEGIPALYCGSLAVIGCGGYFTARTRPLREKIAGAALLAFVSLTFSWQPLYLLFSLLKKVGSYNYRFGFIGSFALLFLAAAFFADIKKAPASAGQLLGAAALISVLILLLNGAGIPYDTETYNYAPNTAVMLLLSACAVSAVLYLRRELPRDGAARTASAASAGTVSGRASRITLPRILCAGAALLLTLSELYVHAALLMDSYHINDAYVFRNYSLEQQAQIREVRELADAAGEEGAPWYRINQTRGRLIYGSDHLTSYYCDSLAYGYAGIASYTSCMDAAQMDFLDRLGYRSESASMQIVNQTVLAADSLLGVRYILTDRPVEGLVPVDSEVRNSKQIFENPYALPAALVYDAGNPLAERLLTEDLPEVLRPEVDTVLEPDPERFDNYEYYRSLLAVRQASSFTSIGEVDPFYFQEALWSALLGDRSDLYRHLDYTTEDDGSSLIFRVSLPEDADDTASSYALYGILPWKKWMLGELHVSDDEWFGYAKWKSPTVFHIPAGGITTDADSPAGTVSVAYESPSRGHFLDGHFAALDLDRLAEVSAALQKRAAADLVIRDGYISCSVPDAQPGEELFLSVPYVDGWTLTVNGQRVQPHVFAGCLLSVPLEEGANQIVLQYHVPGLRAGTALTAAAAVLLILLHLFRRKRAV